MSSMNRIAPPRLLVWLLPLIDALLCRFYRIRPVKQGSILRINFHTFRGKPVTLPDSTTVTPGEQVAEFHLDNQKINQEALHHWHVLDRISSDLCFLAESMRTERIQEIKAFYGQTIHHVGAERLGFLVREVPPGIYKRLSFLFQTALLVVYHPLGKLRLKKGKAPLEMKEVWISSKELLRRYG